MSFKDNRTFLLVLGLIFLIVLITFWNNHVSRPDEQTTDPLKEGLFRLETEMRKMKSLISFANNIPQVKPEVKERLSHLETEIENLKSLNLLKNNAPGVKEKLTQSSDKPVDLTWNQVISLLTRDWAAKPDLKCETIKKAGNWMVCVDNKYEIKPPCLVYSFGINTDWSFDEYMGELGCEVHSFDPSIGKEDHIHSKNVHFHNLGIGPNDTDTFVPEFDNYVKKKTFWKVRRLESIMKMLGHEGRTLDVLKMDIETDEWETMIDMMKSGLVPIIRQFLIEWHLFLKYPSRDRYAAFYQSYKFLKDSGFRSYHKLFHHRDANPRSLTLQADVTYLNTKFEKS